MQQNQLSLRAAQRYSTHLFMLSAVLLSSGLVTFIAANWSGITVVTRFMIVQGAFLFFALLTWQLNQLRAKHNLAKQGVLDPLQKQRLHLKTVRYHWASFASGLITLVSMGGFFALIGQTYQTGADAWQLFALWSALGLPWVIYQRQALLWLFWLLLANLTIALFTEQVYFSEPLQLLSLGLFNLIAWQISARSKPLYWISIILLLFAQSSFHLFNSEIDGWESQTWLFIWFTGILLVSIEIYIRREPISFALSIFYLLLMINSVMFHYLSRTLHLDDTFLFLLMSVSFLVTSGLFFAYLRFVYLSWRKEGEIFSPSKQLYLRRTLNVLKGVFAWLITVSIVGFTTIFLFQINVAFAVLPIVLISILLFGRFVIAHSLLNQFISVLTFSLLAPVWAYTFIEHNFAGLYESIESNIKLLIGLMIVLQWIAFIVFNNRIARTVSIMLIVIYKIIWAVYFVTDFVEVEKQGNFDYFYANLNHILLFTVYSVIALLICAKQTPRLWLFRVVPFSAIPTAAWWGTFLVVAGAFFSVDFPTVFNIDNSFLYRYQFTLLPIFALTILAIMAAKARNSSTLKREELEPKTSIFTALQETLITERKILLFVPLCVMLSFMPSLSAVSFAVTLMLLALVFHSTFNLVVAWLYVLIMLAVNYYSLEIPLINKAYELLVCGAVLGLTMLILLYLLPQPKTPVVQAMQADSEDDEFSQQSAIMTPQRHKINRALVVVGIALPVVLGNFNIFNFERILKTGEIIRFETRPSDPRSMMQGDYMTLAYQLENQIDENLKAKNEDRSAKPLSQTGWAVYHLDENNVAQFERLISSLDDVTLSEQQKVIKFTQPASYWQRPQLRLGHSYFFEEGKGASFANAKYVEFRADKSGKLVLDQLLDKNFNAIKSVDSVVVEN